MTRVLFLDDDGERRDQFAADLAEEFEEGEVEVSYVESAYYARYTLAANDRFDAVFLDHDLGSGCETGQSVADFVAEMRVLPRSAVVHSWNPAGAKSMELTLRKAWIRTFVWPFGGGAGRLLRQVLREIEIG